MTTHRSDLSIYYKEFEKWRHELFGEVGVFLNENRAPFKCLSGEDMKKVVDAKEAGNVQVYCTDGTWVDSNKSHKIDMMTIYREKPPTPPEIEVPWDALREDIIAVAKEGVGGILGFTGAAPTLSQAMMIWKVNSEKGDIVNLNCLNMENIEEWDWENSLRFRPNVWIRWSGMGWPCDPEQVVEYYSMPLSFKEPMKSKAKDVPWSNVYSFRVVE